MENDMENPMDIGTSIRWLLGLAFTIGKEPNTNQATSDCLLCLDNASVSKRTRIMRWDFTLAWFWQG